ncbi:DUF2663 family protein [Shouchella sp. 1P09AA]|uniref:DUF2663 family protein n=1 Tax=unclassified Shouchella TaxID=2893065 RepID=UPI0039A2BCD8
MKSETFATITKELIKRKQKMAQTEKKEKRYAQLTLGTSVVFAVMLSPLVRTDSLSLSSFTAAPLQMALAAAIFVFTVQMIASKRHADKKEGEFEDLRQEFIDRHEELWPEKLSQSEKDAYLKEMNQRYDINLYYRC